MTKPLTYLSAMTIKTFSVITLFFIITVSGAAQTGSFDITIPFAGGSRTIACYVPPDYDSTKSYALLVGLHGSGHNGPAYRDVLIGSANWSTVFPNTICMFPDGGDDQVSDFHAPLGDEEIIGTTVAYAKDKYSIDSSNVMLQGFSLGGRSALKYGLKHPTLFSGLLLNTPAIQGIADAANDPALQPPFEYDAAEGLPMFITIGLEDAAYVDAIRIAVKKLRSHNGAIQHVEIVGMDHTIPPNSVTSAAITFFKTQTQRDHDLLVFDVQAPKHTSSTSVRARAYIQNLGASTIDSYIVAFGIGGKNEIVEVSTPLRTNESAVIEATINDVPPGAQNLIVTALDAAEVNADPNPLNNTLQYYTMVRGERGTTDANEGFETTSRWNIDSTGNLFAWNYDSEVSRSGSGSLFAFNTILIFYTQGLSESVTSPFIDMSALTNKSFSFDYAYNFHRFTAAVLGVDRDFADTLVIEASTNSGTSYTTLFRKTGTALATFATPIMNPVAVNQCYVIPASNEWRHVTIPLDAYATEPNLLIRMRYVSGLGGFINIDNLTVGAEAVSVEDDNVIAGINNDDVTVSPNPATDNITFAVAGANVTRVRMHNNAGDLVLDRSVSSNTATVDITVAELPAGMYSAMLTSGTQTYVRSFAIVR